MANDSVCGVFGALPPHAHGWPMLFWSGLPCVWTTMPFPEQVSWHELFTAIYDNKYDHGCVDEN